MSKNSFDDKDKKIAKNQANSPQKKGSALFVCLLLLLIVIGGFLYWLQNKPENREQVENLVGFDLKPVEDFSREVVAQPLEILTGVLSSKPSETADSSPSENSNTLVNEDTSKLVSENNLPVVEMGGVSQVSTPTQSSNLSPETSENLTLGNSNISINEGASGTVSENNPAPEVGLVSLATTKPNGTATEAFGSFSAQPSLPAQSLSEVEISSNTQPSPEEQVSKEIQEAKETEIAQSEEVSAEKQSALDKDNTNLIEPPVDTPLLALVTEAKPEDQAAHDEAVRLAELKRIQDDLDALYGTTTTIGVDGSLEVLPQNVNNNEFTSNDKIITPRFVQDLAFYCVNNYKPSQSGRPSITISPITVNILYGATLRGFPQMGGANQAREYILNYVYTPAMLRSLYTMYGEQFVYLLGQYALKDVASRPAFTEEEMKQMYQDYASFFNGLAASTKAIVDLPNFTTLNAEIIRLQEELIVKKNTFASIQVQYEETRHKGEETDRLVEQLRELAQEIEKATQDLEDARERAVYSIKRNGASHFSDDTYLYLLAWLSRREIKSNSPEQMRSATYEGVQILTELADQMTRMCF